MPDPARSLYDPALHRDACGVGFVCTLTRRPSHRIVEQGLEMLRRLDHRGALGADGETGDGCGILIALPDAFLREAFGRLGVALPDAGAYAVGAVFLPRDPAVRARCREIVREAAEAEGLAVLGWRDVPVDPAVPGAVARADAPHIAQLAVAHPDGRAGAALDRAVYVARRHATRLVRERLGFGSGHFQIVSLSARTLVYKGMLTPHQLPDFYADLRHPRLASPLAMVHSRFSTNTMPQWPLAQPFRMLCHNGEINTVRGNRNAWRAREPLFRSAALGADGLAKVLPVVRDDDSDSKSLDGALEVLVQAGWPLPEAVLALVPPAWEHDAALPPARRAFHETLACLVEPWDGPATLQFTDGRYVGAVLDRNGLRPSRYAVTADGLVVLASETGVLDLDPATVVRKGRLEPGRMLLVDLDEGRIVEDDEVKDRAAARRPYADWLDANRTDLHALPEPHAADAPDAPPDPLDFDARLRLFGYTDEDLEMILPPMAAGAEAVGSMGDDTPPAVLSERPRLLYDAFRQLFAQVTNPPLDAIREALVTSLHVTVGPGANLLEPSADACHVVRLPGPVLAPPDLARLLAHGARDAAFRSARLDATFAAGSGAPGLDAALDALCAAADAAMDGGARVLVITDAAAGPDRAAVPALLAVGTVHHHLIRAGRRGRASLIVESGEPREVHHLACLLGYGATAVVPTLALAAVRHLAARRGASPEAAEAAYVRAAEKGLLKVMSKMGISTMRSYAGAQVFEALGVEPAVVARSFSGTPSRLGGIGLAEIAAAAEARHADAVGGAPLRTAGRHRWRRGGEAHSYSPEAIARLQQAVRTGRFDSFEAFETTVEDLAARRLTLRSLLDLVPARPPVPLDEVEPWTAVVRRFKTGAMSYGSLSSEAHEALAVAMNRVGGKSNTGEGGEPPPRYARSHPARSAIKQVASGRFGVTIAYLADADEIQIKMAQGAKPGEGGQLPAPKVLPWIAETRHATPFVGLISPPPHHDIYSIEDLAQLIHDLKAANPSARVSVKLVSEVGVGTVAAGVAKAGADTILISGADGGTGAAALTSVAHAGAPWELGLAEAHQALVATGLRSRVRLETDGHLKTGRDVAVAALLGADEFGFATAPLVALGCVMMRKCHLNVCPVGIATQDPALRALFAGEPEHVVNYVHFVAEGLRRHMAALGFRSVAEMVGRVESLRASDAAAARGLDLAPLLARAETPDVLVACGCLAAPAPDAPGPAAGHPDAVAMGTAPGAVEGRARLDLALPVRNLDRAVGTHLSGAMARHALRTGRAHAPDSITLRLSGSAGQSLGAFGAPGLTIHLEGDANDYVGKGLSGARLVLRPPEASPFRAEAQVLLGNVALYGATSGELYARGRAGERFAVRNSGATAVVEGAGDHACEYMTGGTVIVLGPTGRNACAGMSGGQAFFYDPDAAFRARFAGAAADLDGLAPESPHAELLWQTVARHAALTGSALAHALLDDWPAALARFVLVLPAEYRAALERQAAPERVRAEESAAERPMAPAPAAAPAPTLRGRAA